MTTLNSLTPRFDDFPFFELCADNADVVELFNDATGVLRIFPGEEAPQKSAGTSPYCTFNIVGTLAENYLAHSPDIDQYFVNIDIYHDSLELCQRAARAIIGAIQCRCYVDYQGSDRDPETRKHRIQLQADFIECRT